MSTLNEQTTVFNLETIALIKHLFQGCVDRMTASSSLDSVMVRTVAETWQDVWVQNLLWVQN